MSKFIQALIMSLSQLYIYMEVHSTFFCILLRKTSSLSLVYQTLLYTIYRFMSVSPLYVQYLDIFL